MEALEDQKDFVELIGTDTDPIVADGKSPPIRMVVGRNQNFGSLSRLGEARHLGKIEDLDIELSTLQMWGPTPETAASNDIDVVLLDYLLGPQTGLDIIGQMRLQGIQCPIILMTGQGSDGFRLAERLQTIAPAPVIFLTASKKLGLRARAEELGAVGFFEKPYEATELLSAIGAAVLR